MPRRILVLFAHPTIHRSEANLAMLRAMEGLEGITLVDLYGEYPTMEIDIDREQGRLREHDVVVFMFPLYWYSTPAILKEWQDLVLEYGFAYGEQGTALAGKVFFCAMTAGAREQSYSTEGLNHFTLNELLQPLEQTARLCGMHYLPPFPLFGARTALEEGRAERHAGDWRRLLEALRDDSLDLAAASRQSRLNENLDALLGVGA